MAMSASLTPAALTASITASIMAEFSACAAAGFSLYVRTCMLTVAISGTSLISPDPLTFITFGSSLLSCCMVTSGLITCGVVPLGFCTTVLHPVNITAAMLMHSTNAKAFFFMAYFPP